VEPGQFHAPALVLLTQGYCLGVDLFLNRGAPLLGGPHGLGVLGLYLGHTAIAPVGETLLHAA